MIKIVTGPAIVGHLFSDAAEARSIALPVLVGTYADRTGLHVHPAEASLVECCALGIDGERIGQRWTEVRVAGAIVASCARCGHERHLHRYLHLQRAVRGECGHTHRTLVGAARCLRRDQRACTSLGGGAYSDRTIVRTDGGEMSELEMYEIEDILS